MIKKRLFISLCIISCAFSLCACSSKSNIKNESSEETTVSTEKVENDISNDTTNEIEDKSIHLAWLKENGPKFRTDASIISDSNITVIANHPTIDIALDAYMSWYIVDIDYPKLSDYLDTEISANWQEYFSIKETKELAESFDKGPKGDVFLTFENYSDSPITIRQAIENKWFIIEFSNNKDVYSSIDSPFYINLGYTSRKGYAHNIDDGIVLNDYLLKYYGEPNFCGVCLNYNYKTVDELIASDETYSTYDIGWIGDEYGVFCTIRSDEINFEGDLAVNIDDIMIIPKEALEYTNAFSTAPYNSNSTVYNSNIIK